MLKGIDISHHQGDIDFSKVKTDGIDVVFIKATEGKTYQDPNFKIYYDEAKANGFLVGAYHFLRGNAAEDEVNNFLSVVGALDFDCKLVIDAEVDLGGIEATSNQIRAFSDSLKTKGKEVILYTGEYFYNNKLNVRDIPLWVAKYSESKPNVDKDYIGWQYTSSGSVNGISGRVDMNNFEEDILLTDIKNIEKVVDNMSIKDLQKLCNKLGITDYEGKALVEDGIKGKRTESARVKLKELLNIVLQ